MVGPCSTSKSSFLRAASLTVILKRLSSFKAAVAAIERAAPGAGAGGASVTATSRLVAALRF